MINKYKKSTKILCIINKNEILMKYFLITLTFVMVRQICFSQGTSPFKTKNDSTLIIPTTSFSISSTDSDYSIYHYPTLEDSIICDMYSEIIATDPTKENHANYYSLACSLWELGRLKEAENLFLKILVSNEPYYLGTYYNSTDIPGDTSTNTYGYGSYTSNYKNYACRYLSKIYIEEKKFDKAIQYIEYADKKYIVVQNCGTGYALYRREIDGLYRSAYKGLGDIEKK